MIRLNVTIKFHKAVISLNTSAARFKVCSCAAVIGETAIFLPVQKRHLLAENEFTSLISPSAVFLQTSVNINPCFYAANMQSCTCELVD